MMKGRGEKDEAEDGPSKRMKSEANDRSPSSSMKTIWLASSKKIWARNSGLTSARTITRVRTTG